MWQRLFILIILGSSFLSAGPALADDPIEAQAFPYQAGFPRTDPRGTIFFASPSVVDLNNNGEWDILTADSSGCVWGWNHKGQVLPTFPWKTSGACQGQARINGPLAIGDIDSDGQPEVVAGTRGTGNLPGQRGRVFVWNAQGSLLPGWPREMDWNEQFANPNTQSEVYSVALADIAGDNRMEILAGTNNNAIYGPRTTPAVNVYAWNVDGSFLPGYPAGYLNAGIFGHIGAANITGDPHAELITGRDEIWVSAYNGNGQQPSGWPVHTYLDTGKSKWGTDPYLEFTNNAPAMGDLDGDGDIEIVIAGKVRNPQFGHQVTNSAVIAVGSNGQRHSGWKVAKLGGGPLGTEFHPSQAPALADLDNDGRLEIVVALFDGTIRAYRENGALIWSYDYAQGQILYGSEPAIGDVTGDGELDIIFGTYSPDGSANSAVSLLGLNAQGQPLPNFPLPLNREGSAAKRGLRAGPTLADIDRDCDVEILAASQAGVLYVWDLPVQHNRNRVPWPTSRHDNLRTGAFDGPTLTGAPLLAGEPAASDMGSKIYFPLIFMGC
jgi:hypothetical protein